MDIGVQGADLGMKAASEAISGIFNGNADKVEQRIKPKPRRSRRPRNDLCDLLPPMLATQTALAGSLPEFKPYATMTEGDISDCRKHHEGANVSVSSADIGSEIRDRHRMTPCTTRTTTKPAAPTQPPRRNHPARFDRASIPPCVSRAGSSRRLSSFAGRPLSSIATSSTGRPSA